MNKLDELIEKHEGWKNLDTADALRRLKAVAVKATVLSENSGLLDEYSFAVSKADMQRLDTALKDLTAAGLMGGAE